MKQLITRTEPKNAYKDYLGKANEFFSVMQICLQDREWDTVFLTGVHGSISLTDAITVFQKGLRSAGHDHRDAATLLIQSLSSDERVRQHAARFVEILDWKGKVEYEPRRLTEKEAYAFAKSVERYFDWAKSVLPL